ncbi:MAG: hypothetical protein ACXVQJ_04775, partial [Actinomycetota bacterium]
MTGAEQDREEVGLRFVRALAAKDAGEMTSLLDPEVRFRGLTPGDTWQATNPTEVLDVLFGAWFEEGDLIREVLEVETVPVADRERLRYRLRVDSDGEPFLVEQQ